MNFDQMSFFNKANGYSKQGDMYDTTWKEDSFQFVKHLDGGYMAINIDECTDDCDSRTYSSGQYFAKNKLGLGYYGITMKIPNNDNLNGINAGNMLLYGGYDGKVTWIETKFLGKNGKDKLSITCYPDGDSSHSTSKTLDLGFDASLDFHEYGILFTNSSVKWFVDGNVLYETQNADEVPDHRNEFSMLIEFYASNKNNQDAINTFGLLEYTTPFQLQISRLQFEENAENYPVPKEKNCKRICECSELNQNNNGRRKIEIGENDFDIHLGVDHPDLIKKSSWNNGVNFDCTWKVGQVTHNVDYARITTELCQSDCDGKTFSSGEIAAIKDSAPVFLKGGYLGAEMKIPKDASGFMSGSVFTYASNGDEIDIEFIGKNGGIMFQATIWVKHERQRSWDVVIPYDCTENFHEMGFAWTENSVRWYQDGILVHESVNETDIKYPTVPMNALLHTFPGNQTSQGMVSWLGKRTNDGPLHFDIKRFYYVEGLDRHPNTEMCKCPVECDDPRVIIDGEEPVTPPFDIETALIIGFSTLGVIGIVLVVLILVVLTSIVMICIIKKKKESSNDTPLNDF